ncbi:hypothetical protein [Candidatus Hepatobacter penaei]|uniref:hypothetical protein n=1 Tax=Candidatus Hepatobacter penaei TaxID=1274402 RepID=UPI0012E0BB06|nr:hypothetical protein [Candidatus Hepatobacter penaei]
MSGLDQLSNNVTYNLSYTLAQEVSTSLQSQITGQKNLQSSPVSQAMYYGTMPSIAKTNGALQNIQIASQFIDTALTAVQTVNRDLIGAAEAAMTLLNGTVSVADKNAAVQAIIDVIGMKQSPDSRGSQEGSAIQSLRQAGTGTAPFYSIKTSVGTPATPEAAPPKAVDEDPNAAADTGPSFYFNGTGSVPADTFCGPETIQFKGLSASDIGEADPASATAAGTATDLSDIIFSIPIGGKTYTSDAVELKTAPISNKPINLYLDGDRSKAITMFTTGSAAFANEAAALAAFQALFTGSVDTKVVENTGGVFTSAGGTAPVANTFADPSVYPPTFKNVEPGAIQVLSAQTENVPARFSVQVGDVVYSTDDDDGIDLTASPAAPVISSITLYKGGKNTNTDSTITLTLADLSVTNALLTDTAALLNFTNYMAGTYTAPVSSGPETGVFVHDGAADPTGALLPCNPSCFVDVPAGKIEIVSTSYAGADNAGDGTKVLVEVKVGNNTYKTDPAAGGDTTAAGATIVLYKDGDNTSTETITLLTGPIASAPGGPGIGDEDTLLQSVTAALSGSYNAFGDAGSAGSVPFSFAAGSSYGAGYFTLKYDGAYATFYDQFGATIQAYPLSETEILNGIETQGGKIKLGDIGTLYMDSSYTGGAFEYNLITTPSTSFDAAVTVSGNEGSRQLRINNLTDREILYGISDMTIDPDMLANDVDYQKQVKGLIDHALEKVADTIQSLANMLNVLQSDEMGQNAALESLHNLQDTVSLADPLKTAQDVFESSKNYNQMVAATYTLSAIEANQAHASARIAELATTA